MVADESFDGTVVGRVGRSEISGLPPIPAMSQVVIGSGPDWAQPTRGVRPIKSGIANIFRSIICLSPSARSMRLWQRVRVVSLVVSDAFVGASNPPDAYGAYRIFRRPGAALYKCNSPSVASAGRHLGTVREAGHDVSRECCPRASSRSLQVACDDAER